MKSFKKFNENVETETLIDVKELKKFALGIELCCNGEYGCVFYNEDLNSIYVCLGDSNPFSEEDLKNYMLEAVVKNWQDQDKVTFTIENECYPNEEESGWQVFSNGEFKPWNGQF